MNQQLLLAGAAILNVIGTGLLFLVLSRSSRKDMFFAVTVPPAYRESPEARTIETRFRRHITMHIILWLVVVSLVGTAGSSYPLLNGTLLLLAGLGLSTAGILVAGLVAFFSARKKALPHSVKPTAVREASLLRSDSRSSTSATWLLAGPLTLIAFTALGCWFLWDAIPARYPSHWDINGTVNGWTTKSPFRVLMPLLIVLPANLMLLILTLLVPPATRRIFASPPQAVLHEGNARRQIVKLLACLGYCITIPPCIMTLYLPFAGTSPHISILLITTALLVNLVMLACLITTVTKIGESMENARAAAALAGSGVIGDRTDDTCWKWGMIYYNPSDPALFVEKRFGIGWTTNMAHWQSWLIMLSLIFLPGILVFVTAVYL